MSETNCGRGCSDGWDVRCCCELNCPKKNSNLQFQLCPVKNSTIYFHIGNDSFLYELAENNDWDTIESFYQQYEITIDKKQLKKWWKEDRIDC